LKLFVVAFEEPDHVSIQNLREPVPAR
jgi:hypothetical protein